MSHDFGPALKPEADTTSFWGSGFGVGIQGLRHVLINYRPYAEITFCTEVNVFWHTGHLLRLSRFVHCLHSAKCRHGLVIVSRGRSMHTTQGSLMGGEGYVCVSLVDVDCVVCVEVVAMEVVLVSGNSVCTATLNTCHGCLSRKVRTFLGVAISQHEQKCTAGLRLVAGQASEPLEHLQSMTTYEYVSSWGNLRQQHRMQLPKPALVQVAKQQPGFPQILQKTLVLAIKTWLLPVTLHLIECQGWHQHASEEYQLGYTNYSISLKMITIKYQ